MPTTERDRSSTFRFPEYGRAFGERLRAGESAALGSFFDDYFDIVYARVRSLVRSAQVAEDLTQDIFLNVQRSLASYDSGRRLGPWVHAIVMNRVRDYWRSRRVFDSSANIEELPGNESPEEDLERRELDDQVLKAVRGLPQGMRSVLSMRVFDALPFETISRILNLTPTAARKRYSRALKLLRADFSAVEAGL